MPGRTSLPVFERVWISTGGVNVNPGQPRSGPMLFTVFLKGLCSNRGLSWQRGATFPLSNPAGICYSAGPGKMVEDNKHCASAHLQSRIMYNPGLPVEFLAPLIARTSPWMGRSCWELQWQGGILTATSRWEISRSRASSHFPSHPP